MSVDVQGMRELQRRLRTEDPIYAEPLRDALDEAGQMAVAQARGASTTPRGETGQLSAKLTHKVSGGRVPKLVTVKTTAVSKKRYPYPRRLEYDPRSRSKGWLRKAVEAVMPRVQRSLARAAATIEANWGR